MTAKDAFISAYNKATGGKLKVSAVGLLSRDTCDSKDGVLKMAYLDAYKRIRDRMSNEDSKGAEVTDAEDDNDKSAENEGAGNQVEEVESVTEKKKVIMPKEGDEGDVGSHPELNGDNELAHVKVKFRVVPEEVKDEKKDGLGEIDAASGSIEIDDGGEKDKEEVNVVESSTGQGQDEGVVEIDPSPVDDVPEEVKASAKFKVGDWVIFPNARMTGKVRKVVGFHKFDGDDGETIYGYWLEDPRTDKGFGRVIGLRLSAVEGSNAYPSYEEAYGALLEEEESRNELLAKFFSGSTLDEMTEDIAEAMTPTVEGEQDEEEKGAFPLNNVVGNSDVKRETDGDGIAQDASVKKDKVATTWENCKAKNPILCRYHGIAKMNEEFAKILEANGLGGMNFKITRIIGEVDVDGAVAHELDFECPKSMADTAGKAVLRAFGKLEGIDLIDPDDEMSMTERNLADTETRTLFDLDYLDPIKDEPDEVEEVEETETNGDEGKEEEEKVEVEEKKEDASKEEQPATPEKVEETKVEEKQEEVAAPEKTEENKEPEKAEEKKEDKKSEAIATKPPEKKRKRYFAMGGFSDYDDGGGDIRPDGDDGEDEPEPKKEEPPKEFKPDENNPSFIARNAMQMVRDFDLGSDLIDDIKESLNDWKKAKSAVDYLESELGRSLPSESVRKDLEGKLAEKKELLDDASSIISFHQMEVGRRAQNVLSSRLESLGSESEELFSRAAGANEGIEKLLLSMHKREIPDGVKGKDEYMTAMFAFEAAKGDFEDKYYAQEVYLTDDNASKAAEGLRSTEELRDGLFEDLKKKAAVLESAAAKVGAQLSEKVKDTRKDVTARLNESRHAYDHAAGLPGESVDKYIERMKELGRAVPITLPRLQRHVDDAEWSFKEHFRMDDKALKKVNDNFKATIAKVMANSSVGTLAGIMGIKGILTDHMKNFFETGHTGARIEPDRYQRLRLAGAMHNYGVKEVVGKEAAIRNTTGERGEGEARDYEKYGCLMTSNPEEDFSGGNNHNNYGNCFIRFKPSFMCSTISVGDSLTNDTSKNVSFSTDPSIVSVTNYELDSMKKAIKELQNGPLDVRTHRELLEKFGVGKMYVEAQYHGEVNGDCVESLNFSDESALEPMLYHKEIIDELKSRGIKVMVKGKEFPKKKLKLKTF